LSVRLSSFRLCKMLVFIGVIMWCLLGAELALDCQLLAFTRTSSCFCCVSLAISSKLTRVICNADYVSRDSETLCSCTCFLIIFDSVDAKVKTTEGH
jgi:hypothetical protein